ncbi:MAG TPA: metallophosphoesterase [Longimicrobium sp.]|nr:metallophosphoesterase [Longimicrobium sp.]
MKLLVLSDLHVEFAPFDPPSTDADVVVLAGDTAPGVKGIDRAREWFPRTPIVYVAGNHEYYGHALPKLTRELEEAGDAAGVHFLENRAVEIGGARFLGCTLWTDFEVLGDRSYCAAAAQAAMNDFRRIRVEGSWRRFAPADARGLHLASVEWLREALETPFAGPTVVVTHHAPSARSLEPAFRTHPVSAAYASDLEWMMDGARAALWVHGHTHHCVDYEVNGTRVYANQRGYPHQHTGYDPARVVEVG